MDVSDPKHPKQVAHVAVPEGFHAHKVRVVDDIMVVNRELVAKSSSGIRGGVGIYDVSDPTRPREITHWHCDGTGVHRFTFDGRYAYISPEVEGFLGNIVMILDLSDPSKPTEVGRWWKQGQWIAGGEEPTWKAQGHRCHHPIRMGDRLYVSYWHGGGVILDISDMTKPKEISAIHWSPPFPWPMHSLVPLPFSIYGQNWMIVAEEDVFPFDPEAERYMPASLWMVNITDETNPIPVGSFQVEGLAGRMHPTKTGCHQPVEQIRGTEVPCAWFSNGLRYIDISNPYALREVASYVPSPQSGTTQVSSNDVFMDDRGITYLIDRFRGLAIVERTG